MRQHQTGEQATLLPLPEQISTWHRAGGMIELSAMIDGIWVSHCYQGFTLFKARKHFMVHLQIIKRQMERASCI